MDSEPTGIFGDTAIHVAVRSSDLSTVVELLGKRIVQIDEKNLLGDTPLHLACSSGSAEIASFLIDHGADKEAVNLSGFKPIHRAAEGGHLRPIQALVAAGVDPDSLTAHGVSPLGLVQRPDQRPDDAAVFGWLLAHGAVYDLYTAVTNGMEHVVSAMVAAKPDTWLNYPRSREAIVKACGIFYMESNSFLINKRFSLVRVLLEYGANPNEIVGDLSPLLVAIQNNDYQLAELLIKCGADVKQVVGGCSPMQMAKRASNADIVRLLLSHGASDDGLDGSCQYPF